MIALWNDLNTHRVRRKPAAWRLVRKAVGEGHGGAGHAGWHWAECVEGGRGAACTVQCTKEILEHRPVQEQEDEVGKSVQVDRQVRAVRESGTWGGVGEAAEER